MKTDDISHLIDAEIRAVSASLSAKVRDAQGSMPEFMRPLFYLTHNYSEREGRILERVFRHLFTGDMGGWTLDTGFIEGRDLDVGLVKPGSSPVVIEFKRAGSKFDSGKLRDMARMGDQLSTAYGSFVEVRFYGRYSSVGGPSAITHEEIRRRWNVEVEEALAITTELFSKKYGEFVQDYLRRPSLAV
jgi:hypothetical protein